MMEGFCIVMSITGLNRPNTGKDDDKHTVTLFFIYVYLRYMVAQLVEALCYKPEGHRFNS
jgi:hypothetical protein